MARASLDLVVCLNPLSTLPAELAAVVGPYNGYARNADAHKRVMRKHQAANDELRTTSTGLDADIHKVATQEWNKVVSLGANTPMTALGEAVRFLRAALSGE